MKSSPRYIAFSTIHGAALVSSSDLNECFEDAMSITRRDSAFVEILDCGDEGRAILDSHRPLSQCRHLRSVFRGTGFDQEAV